MPVPVLFIILAAFMAGILLAEVVGWWGAVVLAALSLAAWVVRRVPRVVPLFLLVAALGLLLARYDRVEMRGGGTVGERVLEVDDDGRPTRRSIAYRVHDRQTAATLLLYWQGDERFQPGDIIRIPAVTFAAPDSLTGYHRWLCRQGIGATLFSRGPLLARGDSLGSMSTLNRVRRWASGVRASFDARLSLLSLSPSVRAFVQGVLWGDRSELPPDVVSDMRAAGMSHLLAVSGLHVGVIFFILFYIVLRPLVYLRLSWLLRLLTIVLLWCYVAVVGFTPSSVRAATMLSLVLLGRVFRRYTWTWHSILLAALLILLFDTRQLWSVGFQFSFLATMGILAARPLLDHGPWWRRMLFLSLAAQLPTLPLVAYYFHHVPLLGWLQGWLAVPLLPLFVGLAVLALLLPGWSFLSVAVGCLARWFFVVAHAVSVSEQWLLGRVSWHPTLFEALAMLLSIALAVLGWRMRCVRYLFLSLFGLLLALVYPLLFG